MLAMDAKHATKIEPDFDSAVCKLFTISEAVCKRDWQNVRSYLFFNMQTFRMKISDSVCNDLKGILYRFVIFFAMD